MPDGSTQEDKPRIILKRRDVAPRLEPTVTDNIHAFDKTELQVFIGREFPEFTDAIKTASRPAISKDPDELEQWEGAQILARKQRAPFETDWSYIARLLYEETFSVNQSPGNPNVPIFKGVAGLTPGGLISHFYNVNTEKALVLHPSGATLAEAISNIPGFNQRLKFVDDIVFTTHPPKIGSSSDFLRPSGHVISELAANPQKAKYPDDLDSVGYRLVRMLTVVPEMSQLLKDPELRRIAGIRHDRAITGIDVLVNCWRRFGMDLLTDRATFRGEHEAGVKLALADFLRLRTHPEMQIFYKYLSASGYINSIKPTK